MIVLKENERHHATSWQYNSARILTRLAQLITAQGGKVKPLYPAVISDRNLEDEIRETESKMNHLPEPNPDSWLDVRFIVEHHYLNKLEELQSIPNAPITVTHTSYINFAMNGVYYSYSLDNNPLLSLPLPQNPYRPQKRNLLWRCLCGRKLQILVY